LQYLRARWYDPSVGRFINEDSFEGQIDNPLSLNLYTYVHNNPLGFIDPSGHDRAEIDLMLKQAGKFEQDLKKTFGSIYKNDMNQYTYLYNMAAGKNGVNEGQQKWARSQLLHALDAGQANWDQKVAWAMVGLDAATAAGAAKAVTAKSVVGATKAMSSSTSLFRAVGPEEFYNVMKTQKFTISPRGMDTKQFGLTLQETLDFANKYSDIAAIIEIKVPTTGLNLLGDFQHVDPFIFKSGTVTIQLDRLGDFNKIIQSIIHAY
jgi:hypothetical protein